MQIKSRVMVLMTSLLLVGSLGLSAQTSNVQDKLSYSSSLDQGTSVAMAESLPQHLLVANGSASSSQQSGPYYTKQPKKSQAPDFHKYMFDIGFGEVTPISNTNKYTKGLNFQVGFGRNLNRYVGVKLEYDFNFIGIPSSIVSSFCSTCSSGDVLINSISIDPYVNLTPKSRVGLYLVGGGGYNWNTTQFSAPNGMEVSINGGPFVPESTVVDSYSNDAFGMNIGGGINWRLAHFTIYTEARYAQVESQSSKVNSSNPYPAAYYTINYIPATVGFRW